MPTNHSIRIWRYNQAKSSWDYYSRNRPDCTLEADNVEFPTTLPQPHDRDFLFQSFPDGATWPPNSIRAGEIFAVVPNASVPADSDIWYWTGGDADDAFRVLYNRQGTPSEKAERRPKQLAQIKACVDLDSAGDGQLVILRDEQSVLTISKSQKPEEVFLDVTEGIIDWSSAMMLGEIDEHKLLMLLSNAIAANQQKLMAAFQHAEKGDIERAGEAILGVIQGATPGPTQGHNVAVSVTANIDDFAKMIKVCDGERSNEVEGVTGVVGNSIGVVDNGWQALGSLLTFMSDILKLYRNSKAPNSADRADHFGGNAWSGTLASASSSGAKTVAQTLKSFDAIRVLNSSASTAVWLGATTGGIGAFTSSIALVRGVHQYRKSSHRLKALRCVEQLSKVTNYSEGGAIGIKKDTQELLIYAMSKTKRKRNFKAAEAGVATLGLAGSTALTIGAAIAAANFWNPIGWGIGVVAFVAGACLLGYKIYRRRGKAKRNTERGFSHEKFPSKLVQRYLHLKKREGSTTRSARTNQRRSLEILLIEGILYSYGVTPWRCLYTPEIPHLEARILRHLER